ncbi:MAG: transglutaminase-like domain-containing protein [Bacteroidales bacterium]|nr:transglutaminase-like domain-containing protein [Bacteroidales bacterium]
MKIIQRVIKITAKGAKDFRKERKGLKTSDLSFAPLAASLRPLRLVFFITLFLTHHFGFSQSAESATLIVCPPSIPKSETASVKTIAAYINKHYTTEKEKITAIYCWLAHNIAYDVAKAAALISTSTESYDKEQAVKHTLKVRKGVCQDYAELMEALCRQCGIKVYPVYGIVRRQGQIGEAHAWIAAWIDRQWRIYDPTWGAGYVNDGVFTQQFNSEFYDISPKDAVKSHLPLDPMWQLLSYPISVESFYRGDFQENTSRKPFHFSDTIALFERQDTIQQCYDIMRRIEAGGIYNQATVDYLDHLNSIIENDKVDSFNDGVFAFNDAVAALNDYFNYFNRQFTPEKSKTEVVRMLRTAETGIQTAIQRFQSIKNPSPELLRNMNDIASKMKTMSQQLAEQNQFVEKYFNTDSAQRKMLFMK